MLRVLQWELRAITPHAALEQLAIAIALRKVSPNPSLAGTRHTRWGELTPYLKRNLTKRKLSSHCRVSLSTCLSKRTAHTECPPCYQYGAEHPHAPPRA